MNSYFLTHSSHYNTIMTEVFAARFTCFCLLFSLYYYCYCGFPVDEPGFCFLVALCLTWGSFTALGPSLLSSQSLVPTLALFYKASWIWKEDPYSSYYQICVCFGYISMRDGYRSSLLHKGEATHIRDLGIRQWIIKHPYSYSLCLDFSQYDNKMFTNQNVLNIKHSAIFAKTSHS